MRICHLENHSLGFESASACKISTGVAPREQVWANLERQPCKIPTRGTQETTAYFETRNSLAHADCFALGSLFALPAVPPTLERGLEMIRRYAIHELLYATKISEGHGGNMFIAPKANVRSGRATPFIRDKLISPLIGNPYIIGISTPTIGLMTMHTIIWKYSEFRSDRTHR